MKAYHSSAQEPTNPSSFFRLWPFVALAFLLLIAAWASLIFIATQNAPQVIPLEKKSSQAEKTPILHE